MQSMLNNQAVKWGLLVLALAIVPFWPVVSPFSVAIALICLHALGTKVPLKPLRLLGAVVLGVAFELQRLVSIGLPRLDHPEVFFVVPWLYGINMVMGAFIPRAKRLLRPGRLIGLVVVWLALYLFAPLPGISLLNIANMGIFGWLMLAVGSFGIVVGDYHKPLAGLKDLRADTYWHGQRLTEQEEQVREGGRRGERSVQDVLETLDRRQYTAYHGVHLRSQDRQLPKSQEFDHILVGPNGVFHLETKNWRGKVVIRPTGEWMRVKDDGTLYPWENPAEQIERHRKVLLSVLRDPYVLLEGHLVLTNPSTSVEGDHAGLSIIRVDQLKQVIEARRPRQPLSKETRAKYNQRISDNIISAEPFETAGKFIWHLWHWLVIDAVAAALFFFATQWI